MDDKQFLDIHARIDALEFVMINLYSLRLRDEAAKQSVDAKELALAAQGRSMMSVKRQLESINNNIKKAHYERTAAQVTRLFENLVRQIERE
jgi:hypothetical protein